jgi:hypothetical protein
MVTASPVVDCAGVAVTVTDVEAWETACVND